MTNEYLRRFAAVRAGDDLFPKFRATRLDFSDFDTMKAVDESVDHFMKNMMRRQEWRRHYSFAVPNAEAIRAIASYSPIVEMGAGSGYWSHLLRQAGADVVAYDIRPPVEGAPQNQWMFSKQWTYVQSGTPEVLRFHRDRALFLCWPPMDEMAYNSVRKWRGKTLIYVGEQGGCTADENFFAYVGRYFERVKCVRIPQWPTIHDALYVYERKTAKTRVDRPPATAPSLPGVRLRNGHSDADPEQRPRAGAGRGKRVPALR